jgi:hypothetical protein
MKTPQGGASKAHPAGFFLLWWENAFLFLFIFYWEDIFKSLD